MGVEESASQGRVSVIRGGICLGKVVGVVKGNWGSELGGVQEKWHKAQENAPSMLAGEASVQHGDGQPRFMELRAVAK